MSDFALSLGLSPDAKLLIIHADDLGMCHSINSAIFDAFECGAITSASAMTPCPWFPEVADYARKHEECDIGVHLAITSEWANYKWRPVTSRQPGLVDAAGYFLPRACDLNADAESLEQELSSQIDIARDAGLAVSHADCHMYAVFETASMFESYVKVGIEKDVTLLFNPKLVYKDLCPEPGAGGVVLDAVYEVAHREPPPPANEWLDYYLNIVRGLRAGLTQITVHPGYDDAELRAITGGVEGWGAAWRQRDFDVLTSRELRSALAEQEVHLVNWKQISPMVSARQSLALHS